MYIGGSHNTVSNIEAHECETHGIYVAGEYITVDNNVVYRTCLENEDRTLSSGWGSGIKVYRTAQHIVVSNNYVYNNYGEGIAATGSDFIQIYGNTIIDNFSVELYLDGANDVQMYSNFALCNPNSGFEYSNGSRPNGIAVGGEGWGDNFGSARNTIENNIIVGCATGFSFWYSGNVEEGFVNSNILNNTFIMQ